jgi:lipoprotein-anchoring transpeptidase ErfK/SrfK
MRKVTRFIAISCFFCAFSSTSSVGQSWPPWADHGFGGRPSANERQLPWEGRERTPPPAEQRRTREGGGDLRDGGLRPEIAPTNPPIIEFRHDFPVNSIVIVTGERKLYYILGDNRAYAYPISVGREGFNWTGTEIVSRKQAWPDWHPPTEMRERDPRLPVKMTGGLKNPLGAMALYLGNTLYRVHGTNDVKSIGQAQSSGCFRMLNSAVLHLAAIADIGTPVTVIASLPEPQQISRAPDPPASIKLEPRAPTSVLPPRSSVLDHLGPIPRAPDYRALRDYTLRPQ